MWRLSKLDIKGFKSFAEQAQLVFPEGITAVVGPNGCGKSNISDAIVWALGEQSTSVLRAQRMEDVIFQGTASRNATGTAEVTLHLTTRAANGAANGNGNGTGNGAGHDEDGVGLLFPEDALPEELSITRRLYRSGESEYRMNGEKCLLREIRERLLGTGLGFRACFTIGQGRIDQILSASPLERRQPIEEAAGISLYRRRRHSTNLKLEATAQDMARVEDICAEVARQMRSLKRQAGRAEKYRELRDRLRDLERRSFSIRLVESENALAVSRAALQAASLGEQTAREMLDEATRQWEAARDRSKQQRQAQVARRQALYNAQVEHERSRSEASRLRDRAAFAEQRAKEVQRKLGELAEQRQSAGEVVTARAAVTEELQAAARGAELQLQEAHERLDPLQHLENQSPGLTAKTQERTLELHPLAARIEVDDDARGAVALVLGHRLRQPLLAAEDVETWLDAVSDRHGMTRGLRAPALGRAAGAAPASEVVGPLSAAVRTADAATAAVVSDLLHGTWVVATREDAIRLGHEHPEHAFVDRAGSVWARGSELVLRNEAGSTDVIAESSRRSLRLKLAIAQEEEPQPQAKLTSPQLEAARMEVERAHAAARAAQAQLAAARREREVAAASLRQIEAEITRLGVETRNLDQTAVTALERAEASDLRAAEAGKTCERIETEIRDEESLDVAEEAEVAGLESAVAAAREGLERVQARRSTTEVHAAEVRVAREHLHGQIRERLEVEPRELLREARERSAADGTALDAELASRLELHHEIREVRAAIDRLGPVNLVAYDDFQDQEKRFHELDGQRRDLVEAAGNLREAIRRIDEECVTRFTDAFEAIDGYFNRIMRQLFGGGRAGMRLENPDDPLNSGIEIVAQPPGKNLQSIRLLSGGERSMIALALMFAIFEYHPAPFCILDEADAALDERNVGRFVQALNHFQDRAQFIMITHNKTSMEVADLLYGVTMEESGVSKLVSVQLN